MTFVNNKANFNIEYYPFPVVQITDFIHKNYINELTQNFPDIELFKFIKDNKFGNKYSLCETINRKNYLNFIKQNKIWKEFFLYINSIEFQRNIFDKLNEKNINLNSIVPLTIKQKAKYEANNFLFILSKFFLKNKILLGAPKLKTSLEFQIMSADGNYLLPHTDSKKKMLTFCLNLTNSNWKKEYGGGFSSFLPKDISKYYNYNDEFLQFEECDTVKDFDFEYNQANLFIKTFNSLHGVKAMKGPKTALRKSINFSFIYER